MSWLFISDLHLDESNPARILAFENFIQNELKSGMRALYILGDLCEVWVGDDDNSMLVSRLRTAIKAVSAHIPVYFMPGNRDFLLGSDFAESCGLKILPDPSCIEICGQRILISHGDSLCTADVAYQRLRKILRGSAFQVDILAKPISERRALAAALRRESNEANANKADNIMDVCPEEVAEYFAQHQVKHFIHGHTHRPGIHQECTNGQINFRYVLGDWDSCAWALRVQADSFQLECFPVQHSSQP